nr:hypothetical protein [uncultured Pseudomonas sp.]
MPMLPRTQRLLKTIRIYTKQIEAVKKLIWAANEVGFPAEHIHRLEHLLKELEGVASLTEDRVAFPPRPAGRPPSHLPSFKDICHSHFLTVCPPYVSPKKNRKTGEVTMPVVKDDTIKPQEGLVFNFTP